MSRHVDSSICSSSSSYLLSWKIAIEFMQTPQIFKITHPFNFRINPFGFEACVASGKTQNPSSLDMQKMSTRLRNKIFAVWEAGQTGLVSEQAGALQEWRWEEAVQEEKILTSGESAAGRKVCRSAE